MTDTLAPNTHSSFRIFLSDVLNRAVNAPSGDNSQPWRFSFDKNTVTLLNLADADATLYNFRQRGSYFAHGAVIENISILASEQGYRIEVAMFPDVPDATARISFIPETPRAMPLARAIGQRATNRKPYQRVPLQAEHRHALLDAIADRDGVALRFVEGEDALASLARTVSVNERLLMENRTLHDFLFGMIRWSRDEERAAPGSTSRRWNCHRRCNSCSVFVLRHWTAVRLLNFIGLSRFIPIQSAQTYRASSAFGAIVLANDTDSRFHFRWPSIRARVAHGNCAWDERPAGYRDSLPCTARVGRGRHLYFLKHTKK